MRVSTTHIDSGNFRPDTVVAGMFTILANSTVPEKLEIKPATPHSDFVGSIAGYDAGASRPSSRAWCRSWHPGM